MTTQDTQATTTETIVGFSGVARVSDEPHGFSFPAPTHGLHGGPEESSTDGISDEEMMKMRLAWNRTMCKVMKIPEGYQDVAVLIVKWFGRLDELNTKDEVKQLNRLFQQSFRYNTRVVELDTVKSKPQHQLNNAITQFLYDFDGPHKLLIVYYTGHGFWSDKEAHLELHASSNEEENHNDKYPACAIWEDAERPLIDHADCDVLAILDTCYASNVWKSPQKDNGRKYELLAASGHDKLTAGPGPKSFTTALISSLKALLKERKDRPFTIRELCDKINLLRRGPRANNQSQVLDCRKRYNGYITLAPLRNTLAEREKDFEHEPTHAFLTLELPLTVARPTEQQITDLAGALSQAVKKNPVKRINWVNFQNSRKMTTLGNLMDARACGIRWRHLAAQSSNQQSLVTMQDEKVQTTPSLHEVAIESPAFDSSPVRWESGATPQIHMPQKRKHSGSHGSTRNARTERSSPGQDEQRQRPITPLSGTETQ